VANIRYCDMGILGVFIVLARFVYSMMVPVPAMCVCRQWVFSVSVDCVPVYRDLVG
jgi:hypothetical protein